MPHPGDPPQPPSHSDAQTAPSLPPAPTPRGTADLPGTGGELKQSSDDFVVEEIPAYEPSGSGEHLFLWIQKRDLSADQLLRHLERVLQIPAAQIGMAGLKDKHALTTQYISVPARCASRLAEVDTEQVRVLRSARHGNKLKTGHLLGNRFIITLRGVCDGALARAEAIRSRLLHHGFPNYFGEQRFGREGETLHTGLKLLSGEMRSRDLKGRNWKFQLRLSLSAVQSHLFNAALGERLADGLLHRVLAGDVMQVVASGGKFIAEDVSREQARFDAGEITTTGPLFGPKMHAPAGTPLERETALLARHGLTEEMFLQYPKLTAGTRRPYVVRPSELQLAAVESGLQFTFILPPGSYATVLLREFQG